eukprot:102896-Ditylum_brightwellii.AAC.1
MAKKTSGRGAAYMVAEKRFLCPSGNPGMPVEVHNIKMVWLHIYTKSKCTTGSSDEESEKEERSNDKEEVEKLQDLLGPAIAQTIPSMMVANKGVIDLDNNSDSDSDLDMSAFIQRPTKNPRTQAKLQRR